VDLRTPPAASLAPLLTAVGGGKDDDGPLLSPALPTLLLFECVLAYMTPTASNALIQWFVDYFAAAGPAAGPLGGVVYEMFKLNDAFGRVMLNNLKVRCARVCQSSFLTGFFPSPCYRSHQISAVNGNLMAGGMIVLPRCRHAFSYAHKSRGVSLPGVEPYIDLASLSRRFLSLGFSTAQALTLREIRRMYIEPRELQRIAQLEMLDEVEELELVLDHYAISWGLRFPDESSAHESGAAWGLVRKDQLGNEEDHDG
jgi:[phosphatase 2A protein]-leucine-carboxy methyltransferase